jgi:Na+/H+ antiporter NhaD/arsenite permease-like protein
LVINYLSVAIFASVYVLIVLRNLRWFRVPVWAVMLTGAVAMIFSGSIALVDAYASINLNVIFFLLGMFSVVAAMDLSGLLEYLTLRLLRLAKSPQQAFGLTFVGIGLMSAFLVNDTLALMATPIMLGVARQLRVKPRVFLITLAMGVTIGSTMTAIGNPQNLLIALSSGVPNPMLNFLYYLLPPTLACLGVSYLILRWYFRKEFENSILVALQVSPRDAIRDRKLARLSGWAAGIVVLGFFLVGVAELFGVQGNFNLGTVSLLGAVIVFLGSEKRREILRSVDWGIILFFISLFIVMQAFWESGALQSLMLYLPVLNRSDPELSIVTIILTSAVFSQLLSNVPFVAVYIKAMQAAGFSGGDVKAWMALAGGSTLAGGISLLGAASNVIVLEEAESRGSGFGFVEFSKIGILLTIPNLVILYLFLRVL